MHVIPLVHRPIPYTSTLTLWQLPISVSVTPAQLGLGRLDCTDVCIRLVDLVTLGVVTGAVFCRIRSIKLVHQFQYP